PAQFSPEIWQRDEFGCRNLPEFLDIIREVIRQEKVDILLMSAYVNELLSIKEGLFDQSSITPAARANDATDVWAIRHGCYTAEPAQPFRSASIDHIQCGQLECDRSTDQFPGANLGLYSVTFVNDLEQDKATLNAFKSFREEAEAKRFRYFLEVFNPNVPSGVAPEKMGEFINDHILRSLAGVTESGRPVFLKIPYHGPRAMEELVQYDPNMTVGVLGGSAGTTYDAFKLIHDAQKYGARVALYGRKINQAEHQIAFIEMLRLITEGVIGPAEAVHAYHGVLQAKGIKAHRSLDRDMQLTEQAMSYDETQKSKSTVVVKSSIKTGSKDSADASQKSKEASEQGSNKAFDWPVKADGKPDFAAMESAERRAYDRVRLKRTFG
ncbi:MAG TPA: hypothetical protein DD687_13235, partial [Verrucomicrobiales bacterium]|nr:hypothetical protein [Verrucomicrobiales bacterium]